jgi:hypothetical protein
MIVALRSKLPARETATIASGVVREIALELAAWLADPAAS